MKPLVLSLFSGIGGFELAGTRAGFDIACMCEIDPFCRAVLRKNFPGVPIDENIMQFDARPFRGTISVVCGGFPCQPFSLAGKGAGKDDSRYLWPEMLRIIGECQPLWICAENVPGLRARGADDVLCDLEAAGYTAGAFVVGSDDTGNSHRRKRVWIVAQSNRRGQQDGWEEGRRSLGDCSRAGDAPADSPATLTQSILRMAHANGTGRGEREREQSGREELPSSEHGGKALADSNRLDRQILLQQGRPYEDSPDAGRCGYPFPFAPRPDDYESWAAVAAVEPTLMPCSQREIHNLADGLSPQLVRGRRRTRNATLKSLGNSIDPGVAYPFLCWIRRQLDA